MSHTDEVSAGKGTGGSAAESFTQVLGATPLRHEAQYLGRHALLAVRGLIAQRYRRFAYTDIEALVIRPTSTSTVLTVVFSCGLSIGVLMALLGSSGTVATGAVLAVGAVLCLVVNLALGRTCEASLQTRVQRYRLGNVNRLGRAEKLRGVLWERVTAAQGPLTAETLREWVSSRQPAGREGAAAPQPTATAPGSETAAAGTSSPESAVEPKSPSADQGDAAP